MNMFAKKSMIAKLNEPEYKDVDRDRFISVIASAKSTSIAREVFGFSRSEMKQAKALYNITDSNIKAAKSLVASIADGMGTVNYFTNSTQDIGAVKENIVTANEYTHKDDIVGGMVSELRDIILSGFAITSGPEEEEQLSDLKLFDIPGIIRKVVKYGVSTDNFVLYGKVKGKRLIALTAMNPEDVTIKSLNKVDKDGIPETEVTIKDTDPKGRIVNRKLTSSEFVQAWSIDGDRDRLINPTMFSVFPDIELRRLIKDGDQTIFFFIKHLIHQIKVGAKEQGSNFPRFRSGTKLDKAKADEIIAAIKKESKAMIEVTTADWEHKFVHPPVELFNNTKYKQPELNISNWSRIAKVLQSGEDANYSAGYIYLKGLGAKISTFRERLKALIEFIYSYYLGFETVKVTFNQLILKENSQILKEIEFLKKHYGLSPRIAFEALGYDWSHQEKDMDGFVDDDDMKARYTPFFEPNQGLLNDEGGRPGNTDVDEGNDVPRA